MKRWTGVQLLVAVINRATEMSLQLYWGRQLGDHNVSLMGNWKRRMYAGNAELENRREDWVFRTTYDFKSRYFAEFNGAYNGSQKFSPDNRFAFFCSGAIGWMVSEEKFMKPLKDKKILDMFKIRGSIGEIGDDNAGARWAYLTQWSVLNKVNMMLTVQSPYQGYKEATIASQIFVGQQVRRRISVSTMDSSVVCSQEVSTGSVTTVMTYLYMVATVPYHLTMVQP